MQLKKKKKTQIWQSTITIVINEKGKKKGQAGKFKTKKGDRNWSNYTNISHKCEQFKLSNKKQAQTEF